MSISHRVRVDAAAAGMSPLLALVPWEMAEASGASEDDAAVAAWYSLVVLGGVAAALRATRWSKKTYTMAVFREDFSLSSYLRDLTLWCAAYAALSAAGWFYLAG